MEKLEPLKAAIASSPIVSRLLGLLRRKSARDFFFTASSNLGITFLGAIGGILAARLLGAEGRGELAAAVVWAGILAGIVQLGLPQALTYVTAKDQQDVGQVFFTMLVLWILQSVGGVIIGWVATSMILVPSQPEAVWVVRLYLFSIPLALLSSYLSTIALGLKKYELFNTLRLLAGGGYFLALIVAVIFSLKEVRWVVSLVLVFQFIFAIVSFFRFVQVIRPVGSFSKSKINGLLAYGLKSYWGNLSWMANARLDQFVMSAFISLEDLGHYAVAVSYAIILFPLSSAFASVIFPHVAEEKQTERSLYLIKRVLGLNFIAAGIGAVSLALLSPLLIPLLFGKEFTPSVYPAIVLLAGTVLLGSSYVLSDGLRGLGLPMTVSKAELTGAVLSILGLVIVLPRFGISGAAWVSSISYLLVFLILMFQIYRRKRLVES